MIISVLFLATGIYLANSSGNIGQLFWIKIMCVAASIPIAVVAFKKSKKGLAALAMLLIIASYGLGEMNKKGEKTTPDEFANVDPALLGQTIYEKKCMNCHGADGKLGLSGSKDLTISPLSRDEKIMVVKEGKNAMMSFKDQLDEMQINSVVDYVSQLK